MNPSISPTGAPSNSPTEVPKITVAYSLSTAVKNVNPVTFNTTAFGNGAKKAFEAKVCDPTDSTTTCEVTVDVTLVQQRRLRSVQLRMRKLQGTSAFSAEVNAEIKIETEDRGLNNEGGFRESASTATASATQGQTELVDLVTSGPAFLQSVVANDAQAVGLDAGEYS